ncbi:site-specific integrase [Mycolicibacterium stellerae]
MAHIRQRPSGKVDKFGNAIVRYQVVWLEPVRDEFGAPTGKHKQTSETFDTERKAKAHLRKVETDLESAKGIDPSSVKAKANTPSGTYARQYLDSLTGQMESDTIEGYEKLYRTHIAPVFGSKPVASITAADVDKFRAALFAPHPRRSFVTRGKPDPSRKAPSPSISGGSKDTTAQMVVRSPKTVKHIVGTLKRMLDTAVRDGAIASNPVLPAPRRTTKRRAAGDTRKPFAHHPLTANQIASVADWVEHNKGNAVYALAVLLAAHTGVRASELQGLQVQDVTLSDLPGTVGSVRVMRTATKKQGQWIEGTPKSEASTNRVVPLAPWLADELRQYLTTVHPFAGKKRIAHAPLLPGRRSRTSFDWAKPLSADNVYDNYLQPACQALGLGATRWHDLRHSFATMNLSAGEHYMTVSKWLGHSSFVLTLTTYADYIKEDEMEAPKVGRGVVATEKVVPLQRKSG